MNHALTVVGLDNHPACLCTCGEWGFASANIQNDTAERKLELLKAKHAEHVRKHTRANPEEKKP